MVRCAKGMNSTSYFEGQKSEQGIDIVGQKAHGCD